jgi:hypothetical protein
MPQPATFWQKYGTLAQMAQACVALLGFVAVLFQINAINTNQRAASARQIYLGYTDLAFRNPKFAAPDYEQIKAGPKDDQVRYDSFVSYLLYACEEAIAAFASKQEWQTSCDYELRHHLPFLCEKNAADATYLTTYATNTQQWIKASLQRNGVNAPDCKLRKT